MELRPKSHPPENPLLLAIETSTQVSSVALFQGETLIGITEFRAERIHARSLMPAIEALFSNLELSRSDLKGVVLSSGPGSYTGLRVGTSTAKGICLALGIPLIPVNTLEGLAWGLQPFAQSLNAQICPLVDARRDEVFCAAYDAEMQLIRPSSAYIFTESPFAELLDAGKVIFAGDGAAKLKPRVANNENAIVLDGFLFSAAHLGKPGFAKFLAKESEDLLLFEPFYLKEYSASTPKNTIL